MQETTIDEVIARLEAIIAECSQTRNKIGYFAALYHRVTQKVKLTIANDGFEDNQRMEQLVVVFAGRFLTAWDQWKNGQPMTESWQIAFDGTKRRSTIVLQILFLGMNAHINLDLGIATVEIMKGSPISNIHRDFNTINAILGSLVYLVIHELGRVSPLLSLLGLHATKTNQMLVQFSLEAARDGAWVFAEDLSTKSEADFTQCIADRDKVIAGLATSILYPGEMVGFTQYIIHVFEWHNPGKIIGVMMDPGKDQ